MSHEVALVDVSIGQTEYLNVLYDKSYLSFYKAYRSYCIIHGISDSKTEIICNYLKYLRYSFGTRFIALIELKDIIKALEFEYTSNPPIVDDFYLKHLIELAESENKTVFNSAELKYIISSSILDPQFYESNSPFLTLLQNCGSTENNLAENALTELMKPVSEQSFEKIFEVERQKIVLDQAETLSRWESIHVPPPPVQNKQIIFPDTRN